uniref:SFRICE_020358 n=1 Tax=Spodoptera frugiperda TaxID=7108 RepID=A0A2H1V7W7_SPOFR
MAISVYQKCWRAMLRHEWAGSTGVISRPHRKPDVKQRLRCVSLSGNALVTPLVFQVPMGGGDCLPSGNTSARLPACIIKKKSPQQTVSKKT